VNGWLRGVLLLGMFAAGVGVGGTAVHTWQRPQPPAQAEPADNAPPRGWEATVYLPVNDNQRQPFPKEQWQGAVDLLVNEFGGATVGARLEGRWRDGPDV
jgi:hypothetical protein